MTIESLNAQCPVTNSDISFAPDQTGYPQHYNIYDPPATGQVQIFGPPSFFRVTRVVGPGLAAEFSNSSLTVGQISPANWPTYVQNGVASPTAQVELWGNIIPNPARSGTVTGSMTFEMNGVAISQIPFSFTVTTANTVVWNTPLVVPPCVTVSMTNPQGGSLLGFARRQKDAADNSIACPISPLSGETTCPGINEIDVDVRSNADLGGVLQGFTGGATKIVFRAMAPVVMIYGWRGSPQFFATGDTSQGALAFQQPFEKPFIDQKIPYDRSTLTPNNKGTIQQGVAYLAQNLQRVLDKFGAKECHIIAHSMGGLWTRGVLPKLGDLNIGVFSFTTLDTPNKGAFLADLVAYGRQDILRSPDLRNLAGLIASPFLPGVKNLTRDVVADFNLNTADPPDSFVVDGVKYGVRYYSVASDADLDGNGIITGTALYQNTTLDESAPYPLGAGLWNRVYNLSGKFNLINPNRTFSIGHWEFQFPHWQPFGTFQTNDLIVVAAEAVSYQNNTDSAERFEQIPNAAIMKHNHNTVGKADTAQAVIAAIRRAQPIP